MDNMFGTDVGKVLIKFIWKGLTFALKILFKVFIFCGGLWLLLPLAFALIVEKVAGTGVYDSKLYEAFITVFFIVCIAPAVLTFVQNVVRLVTRDRSFSIFQIIKTFGEKKGFEAKLGNDVVALKTADELTGMVFGKIGKKYAVMPETTDGHALIIGGAGSGKSAAIAIPTLMSWKEKVFAIDIKGELYEKTKKARNAATIKVFNPTDPKAYGYDPYAMLKQGVDVSSDARQLAISICPLAADVKDPFWIRNAQDLLTGLIVFFYENGANFSETMSFIKSQPIKDVIALVMAEGSTKAKSEISQFSGMDEQTLSGVYAEVSSHITVFATNDDLQHALSGEGECITPNDLENGYDVFCCIPEHKLDEWKDLLGMMCNQFLKAFERRPENNKTPILFLIDEFPRLGKINAISNGLATLRSKKIHITLVVQSKSQLNAIYGHDTAEVIADNCSYKAILRASEPNTQEWCSKLVGTFDKRKTSSNYNADVVGMGKGMGTGVSKEEKRIIKPEEFAYLKDVVCIFPNGYKRLAKANYYEDKTFLAKM